MDEATKDEVRRILDGLSHPPKSRLSPLILKIAAGYLTIAVFTIGALVFSSLNLYAMNQTARKIANVDLPVLNALIKMRSSLLAQESFVGKYTIFGDATFIGLYRQRARESMANLAVLESTDSVGNIAELKRLYLDYQMASEKLFAGKSGSRVELQGSALRLLDSLDALYIKRQDMLQTMLKRTDDQQRSTTRWAIWICCSGFLLAIGIAPLIIYRISLALRKLQKATHRIAQGDFNYEPQVPAVAEISDLTSDFNEMAARLKEMEQMNIEARPLTRLPGNLAIERVLDERLKSGTPFAFCHANLENFKPFSAHYGYAKGSKLLLATGYLISKAVREHGAAKDFAGHVGGDDFVMVLSTDKAAPVCEAVIRSFDAEMTNHLDPEHLEAGGIERCDRFGVHRFFPITTISISVMNCSADEYASAVEIGRAAADLKDCANKAPGSSWGIAS